MTGHSSQESTKESKRRPGLWSLRQRRLKGETSGSGPEPQLPAIENPKPGPKHHPNRSPWKSAVRLITKRNHLTETSEYPGTPPPPYSPWRETPPSSHLKTFTVWYMRKVGTRPTMPSQRKARNTHSRWQR